MMSTAQEKTTRRSVAEQANAFALVLGEEFSLAFTFYDGARGTLVLAPPSEMPEVTPDEVIALATAGQADVRPLSDGRLRLVLPLRHGGKVTLVATANLTPLSAGPRKITGEFSGPLPGPEADLGRRVRHAAVTAGRSGEISFNRKSSALIDSIPSRRNSALKPISIESPENCTGTDSFASPTSCVRANTVSSPSAKRS